MQIEKPVDCTNYSPSIPHMGDCRNCGNTPQAHWGTLQIDEKWSIRYDHGCNDRPFNVFRNGEMWAKPNEGLDNLHTALFYALLSQIEKTEAAIEAAGTYCWERYKDRPPINLKSPAVFTSHEHQKIREYIVAALEAQDG